MSIRAGQVLHDAQGFVLDRLQTAGITNLNIPLERVYETGNFQAVATIRDVPDLSFEIESNDVSCEFEAILTGLANPDAVPTGWMFDFASALPIDVVSPFKSQWNNYAISAGVAIPYLTLETVLYRFGVGQASTQQFTMQGDSLVYLAGTPKTQTFNLSTGVLTYNFAQAADVIFVEAGNNLRAYSACVKNPTTGAYHRLFFANDYTNTSSGITLLQDWTLQGYTKLHVTYGTTASNTYPQSVHPAASVKPAAVRGKDIDIYISNAGATATLGRWDGVQSAEATRRVNLEGDQEFGNQHYVIRDYDQAEVSGTITVRPSDPTNLIAKVLQVANVPTGQAAGPLTSAPLGLEYRINHPDTGARMKTIWIPDARITIPVAQARVQQKADYPFQWASDAGLMYVYNGAGPRG